MRPSSEGGWWQFVEQDSEAAQLYWSIYTSAACSGLPQTFDVQISDSPEFLAKVFDSAGLANSTLVVDSLDGTRNYFWRVRGVTDADEVGPWSLAFVFTVAARPVGISSSDELSNRASLHAAYPNPFNPQTTIPFAIQSAGHVLLEVFDLRGGRVGVLVDHQLNAGHHAVRFDAARLPSGVYLYRLETGNYSESKRMLLLK